MSFLFKSKAQDASNEEIWMKSHIRLFNEAKSKGDTKFLDWLKRSWNAAKVKPNYKAISNTPAYRELEKLASDECENAQDGNPTKFFGICHNGANYFVTATSVEQARRELEEKAKKDGRTIQSVRVAEDADDPKQVMSKAVNILAAKNIGVTNNYVTKWTQYGGFEGDAIVIALSNTRDKNVAERILNTGLRIGGMSIWKVEGDKIVGRINGRKIAQDYETNPAARDADEYSTIFKEFLQTREFKYAVDNKMKSVRGIRSIIDLLDKVEGDVAEARVGFVYAAEKAVKMNADTQGRMIEERNKMEKWERAIIQAMKTLREIDLNR